MRLFSNLVRIAPTIFIVMGCAKGSSVGSDSGAGDAPGSSPDTGCGTTCDQDYDGVIDSMDQCPNSSSISTVNDEGCADSQLTATLESTFPSYGLTWTPTGELGKGSGLTWTYTGIERGDLFHIDWIVCDDPATPCGLSLDGPIDAPAEAWQFSAADSDLPNGKLVLTNATHILLADATTPALTGRLTLTITDGGDAPIPFADVATLNVPPRSGQYGAEITGTAFKVVILAEVQPASSSTWSPYNDYYEAAPTPVTGGDTHVSFGGSFYDK